MGGAEAGKIEIGLDRLDLEGLGACCLLLNEAGGLEIELGVQGVVIWGINGEDGIGGRVVMVERVMDGCCK